MEPTRNQPRAADGQALDGEGHMRPHAIVLSVMFLIYATLAVTSVVHADEPTPAANLVGIKEINQRVTVSLQVKGADEFRVDPERVDPEKVKRIVLDALSGAGISAKKTDTALPMLSVSLSGESTGGGGASYAVELFLRAHLPSPFAKERSIEAIIWKGSSSGREMMRFDPAAKKLGSPGIPVITGQISLPRRAKPLEILKAVEELTCPQWNWDQL
jgi:hypothetical protein